MFVLGQPPPACDLFEGEYCTPRTSTPCAYLSRCAVLPRAQSADFTHLCGTEFILQAYGAVLSPLPGAAEVQGNLSRALTSVVGVACLRAEGGVGPQLTSHVFGLLKARTAEDLSPEDRWLSSDEGAEWVIRTVDTVLNALAESDQKAKL